MINTVLLRSCVFLWLTGLVAMWVARALLALAPASLVFQVAAGLWILGGLGYTGLALHGLTSPECKATRERAPTPGDLSALLRRR